jgi:parallel beta-helix repeat protein
MRASLTLVAIALLGARVPAQTTHHVPQEHATITEAVAAAANGDTILVSKGLYQENVVITGFTDLTLKAKGKVIISPASGTGLTLDGCGDCTVTGFQFTDCATAIILHSSHDVVVSKCRSTDTAVGFRIEGGNDNTLSKCRVDGTNGGDGIRLDQTAGDFGNDHILSHCTVTDAAVDGIVALGNDHLLDHCKVVNPGQDGIVLDDLAHCFFDTVNSCKVIDSQRHGFALLAADLKLTKCRIIAPVGNGILDLGCTDTEFDSCAVTKAGGDAIGTSDLSHGGSIHHCKLSAPTGDGLLVQGSSMTVAHNKLSKSLADGIGLHCSNSTFTSNTVSACAHDGFALLAGDHDTLTSNKAHGSGNLDLDDIVGDATNIVDGTNKFGTTGP